MLIGDGYDTLCCLSFAVGLLHIFFEDSECNSRLSGGSGLGNYYDSGVAQLGKVHKLREILLAEVVAGKYYLRVTLLAHETVA